jgi:hypothetical protein
MKSVGKKYTTDSDVFSYGILYYKSREITHTIMKCVPKEYVL